MNVKNIFLLVLVSIAMLAMSGCTVPLVSEREIEIESEKNFDDMKMSNAPSTDVSQRNYVVCVARAIIEQTEEPYRSLDWEIVVFDDDQQIQAFAMAGGKIGVFTGLLKLTENQHQLATVLGHEVAHVTQQHMYERINREATTQIGAERSSGLAFRMGAVRKASQIASAWSICLRRDSIPGRVLASGRIWPRKAREPHRSFCRPIRPPARESTSLSVNWVWRWSFIMRPGPMVKIRNVSNKSP